MIVARIRQMRDGGLPADKDDLDDLRNPGVPAVQGESQG